MAVYQLIKNQQVINTVICEPEFLHIFDDVCDSVVLVEPDNTPPPPPPPPPPFTQDLVRKNLTLPERVKWDNNLTPEIITVKMEMMEPLTQDQITPLLEFLVSEGVIAATSMNNIIAAGSN
jgi:hypothetical protein